MLDLTKFPYMHQATEWVYSAKFEPRTSSRLGSEQIKTRFHELGSTVTPLSLQEIPQRVLIRLLKSDIEDVPSAIRQGKIVSQSDSSSIENTLNQVRIEDFKTRFGSSLLEALKQDPFEPGVLGPADSIIKTALSKNALATMTWLNELFVDNFRRPSIAADLLALVSRIPYELAKPAGLLMALAGFSHQNAAVQESAIRAFENWASPDSLKILEGVQVQSEWLKEYLAEVIVDIKSSCEAIS